MKLKKVKIKNFRGYSNLEFDINDLNVIVGKNDVGKSTLLEALDIYFNNTKVDNSDYNVYNNNNEFSISCEFDLEQNYIYCIDSSIDTDLREEYLLNKNNNLEIKQVYNGDKPKLKTVLIAKHPTNFDKPLITLKRQDLQKYIKDNNYKSSDYKLNINKELRKCIFENNKLIFNNDEFEIETNQKDSDIINLFERFKNSFPKYMLFKVDRTNTDQDSEVIDSLKAITKTAVSEIEPEFNKIKEEINNKIKEIADATLEKLKNFSPEIANTLNHELINKQLDSLFSFNFRSDDNISFNKRGSGVRRLLLLSFFLAESERKNCSNNIIYAIEEPETSQHPDFQQKLIESFINLSESKRQIFITTHTPEILKLVDKNSVIFLEKDGKNVNVYQNNDIKLKEIIKELGILPFVSYKGVLFVEGITDIRFIKNINNIDNNKKIIDIDKYSIIDLEGCNNIDKWVKNNYLEGSDSNIKSFYFKDRDDEKLRQFENEFNKIQTKKREIENYIPYQKIEQKFNVKFSETEINDYDNLDVAEKIYDKLLEKKKLDNNIQTYGKDKKSASKNIKNKLESDNFWNDITPNDFKEEDLKEFKEWFNKINNYFNN